MSLDPRYGVHNVTVQQLPPTNPRPKKKLSHAVKARPSTHTAGVFVTIPRRAASIWRRAR